MYLAFRARLREAQISTPAGFYDPCQAPECVSQRAAIQARRQDEAGKLHDDIALALKQARKRYYRDLLLNFPRPEEVEA